MSGEGARQCWWLRSRAERSFFGEQQQSSSSFTTGNENDGADATYLLAMLADAVCSVNGFAFCCPTVTLSVLSSAPFSFMSSPQ